MLGHLETIGVPYEHLRFFEARYGRDYESPNAVINAATEDGFEGVKNRSKKSSRTQLACHWNWCKILTEIIDSGIIVLILLDDRRLLIEWTELCRHVRELIENHQPFHVLQLGSRCSGDQMPPTLNEPTDRLINKGIEGPGDYGTIVSPAGAQRILDAILDHMDTEGMFFDWSERYSDQTGLFHFVKSIIGGTFFRGNGQDVDHFDEEYLNYR